MSMMMPKLYGILITWMVPFDDGGSPITGYRIFRGDTRNAMEFLANVSADALEFTDTGLEAGRDYHYQVSAMNAFHEGPKSWYLTGPCYGLPDAPEDFNVVPGIGVVKLEWEPPEDDSLLKVIGYIINRGTDPDTLPELALVDVVTSYTDDTVENGVAYYYAIAAINKEGAGEFAWSAGVTPIEPLRVPERVTLGGPVPTKKEVTLIWTPPGDDGGSLVTGYVIYRGESEDELEAIDDVGPSVVSWTDKDVKGGKTYWYTIAPKNDVGEGEPAVALEVKVPKDKDEGPGFGSLLTVLATITALALMVKRRRRF